MRWRSIRRLLRVEGETLSGGPDDLQTIRNSLVDAGLIVVVAVTTLGAVSGLIQALRVGYDPSYNVHGLLWICLMVLVHYRHKTPFALKTALFLGVFLSLAVRSLWLFGLSGMAPLMMTLLAVLSGVFFGLRGGLVALGLNAVLSVAVGLRPWLGLTIPGGGGRVSMPELVTDVGWVTFVSILIVVIVEALQRGLLASRKSIAVQANAIREANRELEAQVAERQKVEGERDQIEIQLRQSEKMRAIGQLAGGVAHDFNNQLTGIIGCAQLLQTDLAEGSEQLELADEILTAGRRAADLTRQLLAYARRGKYQSVEVEVHGIVGEVVALLSRSIDKNIRIEQQLYAQSTNTSGDPSQLQNAILNVGINARDAMEDGGLLTFATSGAALAPHKARELGVSPGDYVKLTISDTGTGMDQQTLSHIFEPFFTTKDPGKGTGMGLAAVYGTIRNHKGAVRVRSQPRKGTAVDIYLPIRTAGGGQSGTQEDQDVDGLGGHILVIDDESVVRNSVSATLKRMGYRVTMCAGGVDGLAAYGEHWEEIDAVILDMVMPGLSGVEVFFELRRINSQSIVIATSGYSPESDTSQVASEADAFLQKPFTREELGRALEEALGTHLT